MCHTHQQISHGHTLPAPWVSTPVTVRSRPGPSSTSFGRRLRSRLPRVPSGGVSAAAERHTSTCAQSGPIPPSPTRRDERHSSVSHCSIASDCARCERTRSSPQLAAAPSVDLPHSLSSSAATPTPPSGSLSLPACAGATPDCALSPEEPE